MESANPSSTNFNQTGSFSYNTNSNMKYGGIIKKPFIKQLRKNLSLLLNYVDSVTVSYSVIHYIITIFRLVQFAGPSLVVKFSGFWSKSDYSYQTLSIISIFFHLIPPDYRDTGGFYFLIVYIVLLFLVNLLLIVSAKYFQKNANLPSFIPPFISIYFATFGYVLHPIGVQIGFSQIGMLIFYYSDSYKLLRVLSLVIFSVLISIIYFWIYISVASKTLLFKPNSLQSTTDITQNLFFIAQLVVTILTSFVETAQKDVKIIFLIITALVYFSSILIIFYYGGIINIVVSSAFMATAFTSGLMCVAAVVTIVLNKNGIMAFIIGYVVVFIVSYIVSLMILKKYANNNLIILDMIIDDNSEFSRVKTVNRFMNIAVSGFRVGHPACVGWQFMKLGIEKWPQNQYVWFIYAKFVVIYPEETQTLWWIFRNIITGRIHGGASRTVKEQSMSIARQREPNLSPDLKTKLNSVSKHLTSTKHKLRHVWDLAIQGNVNDMESATKRAIKEIEKSDAELLHILRQFPNNRFVTRQYARFCHELKADHKTYLEMVDKTRQLHRGLIVNKDQAHEFGLETFDSLPDKLSLSKEDLTMKSMNESITTSQMELETEDENSPENDESMLLVNRINNLVIPSTRYSIIIRVAIFVCLFIAPVVALLVVSHSFVEILSGPLQHMHNLAMLRTYVYQIVAFSEERVFEMRGFLLPPAPSSTRLPESFGSTWDTKEQLIFIIAQTTASMQEVEKFRTLSAGNNMVKEAQSIIFDTSLYYEYYSGVVPTGKNVTILMGVSDIITQQNLLISEDETLLPQDFINSSVFLNPLMNHLTIVDLIDKAINDIVGYLSSRHNDYTKMFTIIMVVIIIVILITYVLFTIYQILWINSNKIQVYKCLTSLPKNAVSSLAENLRVLKKEDNSSSSCANSEMNKQEDNILKIFVTGGTSSSTKWIDAAVIIIFSIVTVVLHIVCTVVIGLNVISMSKNLRISCSHINNIQGAYGLVLGAQTMVTLMLSKGDPMFDPYLFTKSRLNEEYIKRITLATDYYHMARFGGASKEDVPYAGFDEAVAEAQEKIECVDPYAISSNFNDAIKCFSADIIYVMLEGLWNLCVVPYINEDMETLPFNVVLDALWAQLIFPVYDAMFEPMTRGMVQRISDDIKQLNQGIFPIIITILVIAILSELLILVQVYRIQNHIKNVLRLLLHVNPKVVMQTPKIMTILGGNFKENKIDAGTRNSEFFHSVVMNLPDAIIVTNSDNVVKSVNTSFTRICGLEADEVVDKHLKDVLKLFSPNALELLNIDSDNNNNNNSNNNNNKDNFKDNNNNFANNKDSKDNNNANNNNNMSGNNRNKSSSITFRKSDNTEISLEASLFNIATFHFLTLRDITQTVRYNTLINEEKNKSDQLLASILPPSLVKRVQQREKNISFAVQTASIVFMDIVSFTPWCGSLPADKVMMTLNLLFKKFDSILGKYSTMTKIKCIGDCYMGAGGVFSEVNQPSEHAKEVVSFGLDSIKAVEELNQEIGEKLQIRVGINTGGPIVAGVLGIGKPTFEILGPTINMAQQMEHHGIAMQVHVSRSVYELIYGDQFIVKERGTVEVKNGTVVTYLVSRSDKK